MVVAGEIDLLEAALEPGVEEVGGVGRELGAEQVERQGVVQVHLLLDGGQIDHAQRPHPLDVVGILDPRLPHRLTGALDDARDTVLTDEHVERFLGQHEAAGARQRVEARLRQRLELHLAVAVGEEREHVERQPVRRLLVEGAQHARRVVTAGAAPQELLSLLAAVAPEVLLEQIDHRPQVPPLLDVHLEQVAHVVERRRSLAQVPLLLDRRGLGVALDHDQAAQHGAVLAGDLLPRRLALVRAERDGATLDLRREQDAPPVLRHLDVVEHRPVVGAL